MIRIRCYLASLFLLTSGVVRAQGPEPFFSITPDWLAWDAIAIQPPGTKFISYNPEGQPAWLGGGSEAERTAIVEAALLRIIAEFNAIEGAAIKYVYAGTTALPCDGRVSVDDYRLCWTNDGIFRPSHGGSVTGSIDMHEVMDKLHGRRITYRIALGKNLLLSADYPGFLDMRLRMNMMLSLGLHDPYFWGIDDPSIMNLGDWSEYGGPTTPLNALSGLTEWDERTVRYLLPAFSVDCALETAVRNGRLVVDAPYVWVGERMYAGTFEFGDGGFVQVVDVRPSDSVVRTCALAFDKEDRSITIPYVWHAAGDAPPHLYYLRLVQQPGVGFTYEYGPAH